jgi:glycosyltransferase involved in cell wall biosynthesis
MPAVSVITPAYNVEPYLADAVRSALAQTFDDLEILIIDDGSTDGTAEVARRCAATDPRVRVFHKPNGGISTARNLALQQARGQFIAILDSDDLWEPEYLEAQIGILQSRPDVAIVTGNGWFLGGAFNGQLARPCPDTRRQPDLAAMLEDETAVFIMSVFHRELVDTIGGFDESLRTNEDYDYWLRAACAGFRFHRNDRGILRVLDKTRPALEERPVELAILERKATEFESRRLAVEARLAIEAGDFPTAAARLAALRGRTGGPRIHLASAMARWTPGLLARVYHLRRGLQGATP